VKREAEADWVNSGVSSASGRRQSAQARSTMQYGFGYE
jgi:hypothetical protein